MEQTVEDVIPKASVLLQEAIEQRIFPGAVLGVVRVKSEQLIGERSFVSVGRHRYDHTSPLMGETSIFDVASVTKTIPTSLLALQLIDAGKLFLEDAVVRYLPELQMSQREEIKVKHLLTHTLEFQFALSQLKDLLPEAIKEKILTMQLAAKPGFTYAYVNSTSILLGWIIERVTGLSLAELAKRELFEPLGLSQTTFSPETLDQEQIVPTEFDEWRGREIKGEVHDESAWKLGPQAVGSAGLFSTAGDLLTVVEMVLKHGSFNGRTFLSSQMIEDMSSNQLTHLSQWSGLGWELRQTWMGEIASEKTIGKTGFTGCVVMADLSRGLGLVLLSNAIYPHRPETREQINDVRRKVADLVWQLGL